MTFVSISGDCNNDQFIVRANEPLPVLCGNNSRQHLYVDVRGRKETNLNILRLVKKLTKKLIKGSDHKMKGLKHVNSKKKVMTQLILNHFAPACIFSLSVLIKYDAPCLAPPCNHAPSP